MFFCCVAAEFVAHPKLHMQSEATISQNFYICLYLCLGLVVALSLKHVVVVYNNTVCSGQHDACYNVTCTKMAFFIQQNNPKLACLNILLVSLISSVSSACC